VLLAVFLGQRFGADFFLDFHAALNTLQLLGSSFETAANNRGNARR
jgi:hypothetical protein